ncbi:MAG: hypothetical protein M5R40_02300 [Anaerolineae bacterium]|nr:hypothetical protein [Anaerolineae bacterium]
MIDKDTAALLERAVRVGARLLRTALPPQLTREVMAQQFEVSGPTTVYVKATGAQVSVRRRAGRHVSLEANLYVSAGLDVATQQDAAGIYIVALRKRLVGGLSRSDLRLTLPPDCDLIADLDNSNLHLNGMTGRVTIPGARRDAAG